MSTIIAIVVAFVYAAAAAMYLATVLGEHKSLGKPALVALCVGLGLHGVALGMNVYEAGFGALMTIQRGLSLMAWMIGVGFVVVHSIYKLRSLGSFAAPLMMLLHGAAVIAEPTVEVHQELEGPLLTVHIVSALLGTALFFLAAMTSVLYLMQERNLKRKRFGPLFEKLPSVDVLDRVGHRLVIVGFPIYTGAIGLGGFWAWGRGEAATLQLQYLFAIVSWLIYAGILHARVTSGWRGRRAALLTIAGLVGIAAVLSTYLLRSWG